MIGFLLSAFIMLLAMSTDAHAPIKHGTAVAFAANKAQLILAVDSHLQVLENQTIKDDNGCKITKLTDHLLLAVSGIEDTTDHKFSSVLEGKKLAARNPPTSVDQILALGKEWGRVMSQTLGPLLSQSKMSASLAANTQHPTVGTFAAFVPDYGLFVDQVTINVEVNSFGVNLKPTDKHFKPIGFYETGWGEVIYKEILAQATPRSKEAAWLIPLFKSQELTDMKKSTLALVSVGKAWAPTSINGDIDQVQLDKSGVQWLHLKPSCSAN
jgi:hypothetical protein